MRYFILLILAISLSAHSDKLEDFFKVEASLETKYTINDDLADYRIDGILLDSEQELPKEGFDLSHLSFSILKEYKNLTAKLALSSHLSNDTYIEEASLKSKHKIGDIDIVLKGGKFFSNFAYLNSHSHSGFLEKPLSYRFFSDDLNDKGIGVDLRYKNSYFSVENLAGDEYPSKDSDKYLLGSLMLSGGFEFELFKNYFDFKLFSLLSEANGRLHSKQLSHKHSNIKESCSSVDNFCFSGDVKLYGLALKHSYKKLNFLIEYIYKKEDGYLRDKMQKNSYTSEQNGLYLQSDFDILDNLNLALRYNRIWSDNILKGSNVSNLAQKAHLYKNNITPQSFNIMLDFKLAKYHNLKLQYDINDLYDNDEDTITFAYILNFHI